MHKFYTFFISFALFLVTNSLFAQNPSAGIKVGTRLKPTSQNVCIGSSLKFENISTGTIDSIRWVFGTLANPQTSTQDTITVNFATAATITVRLIVYSNSTVIKTDTAKVNIIVNPLPVVTATATPAQVCKGDTCKLTGGGAVTYLWNNGIIDNVEFEPLVTQTYTVTGTSDKGCKNTANITVPVNLLPTPTISPISPQSICIGSTLTLNGSPAIAASYQWFKNDTLIAGAITKDYLVDTAANYRMYVKDAKGCSDTSANFTLSLNTLPTSTISFSPANANLLCTGENVVLKGNAGAGLTYQWFKGVTILTGDTSINYTANTAGSYTLRVTDSKGCQKISEPVIVTLLPLPTATITPVGPLTICPGSSVTLTANTGTGLTYQWQKDNVNIVGATSITYAANSAGNYRVIVTNANDCKKTSTSVTVSLASVPTLSLGLVSSQGFTTSGTIGFAKCGTGSNNTLTVSNTSTSTNDVASYTIDWGNGSSINFTTWPAVNPSITYAALGGYNLTFSAITNAGCTLTRVYKVYLGSNPAVGITNPGNTTLDCTPITIGFPVSGYLTNSPGTKYWVEVFGSGIIINVDTINPTGTNFNYNYNFSKGSCGLTDIIGNKNSYYLMITADNMCSQSFGFASPVRVNDKPKANFGTSVKTTCINNNVIIQDSSYTGYRISGNPTTCNTDLERRWSISPSTGWALVSGTMADPTDLNLTSTNLTVRFTTAGTYSIKLWVNNDGSSCPKDSITKTICVQGNPTPNFTFLPNPTNNCTPEVSFTNTTTNFLPVCDSLVYQWSASPATGWQFSGGTSASTANPKITFTIAGTYMVKMQVTNICSTYFIEKPIIIKSRPTVSLPSNKTYCGEQTLAFGSSNLNHNPSINANNGTISAYLWTVTPSTGVTFTPNNTSANPTIKFPATNISRIVYTVTLRVTNECGFTDASQNITINPIPLLTLSSSAQPICSGDSTEFVFLSSTVIPSSANNYSWSAVATTGITGFIQSGVSSIIPIQTISTTASAVGTVTYTTTVVVANNCSSSVQTHVVTVNPLPVAQPIAPVTICSGETVPATTINSNVVGTTYSWFASATAGLTGFTASGNTANLPAQTITNNTTTNGTVTYTIYPVVNNCPGAPITFRITVKPKPIATASGAQPICSGATTAAVAFSSGVANTTYSWSSVTNPAINFTVPNASGTTANIPAQIITNTNSVPGTVTFTIIPTANGCVGNSISHVVTVNPLPLAIATPATQPVCSGIATLAITLGSNVTGTTYSWSSAVTNGITGATVSGTSAPIPIQTLLNTSTSTGTVTYTIIPTANNCPGPNITSVVTVNPRPTVTASPANQTLCSGVTTTAVNFSSNIVPTGNTTFAWTAVGTSGIVGFAASGSGPILAHILTTTNSAPGTVTYTVTPTYNNCAGSAITYIFTVNPIPTVTNTTLTQTICSGANTTLVNLTSGVSGATFSWSATATPGITGFTSSGINTIPVQTLLNSGNTAGTVTYIITPTANSCNGPSVPYVVTVNPTPTVTNTPLTQDICTGSAFTSISLTSNVLSPTFSWTASTIGGVTGFTTPGTSNPIPTQTLSYTGNSFGTVTYAITPTANSCLGPVAYYVIRVFQKPTVADAGPDQSLCNVTNVTIATMAGNSPTAGTGTWSYVSLPGGSTITTPTAYNTTITGLTVGTYVFRWTISNGACTPSSSEVTIIIHPASAPGTITGTSPICYNSSTTLTLAGNTGNVVRWEKAEAPSFTWTTVTNATATLITGNLTKTTRYRVAVLSGGVCSEVLSNHFEVVVDPTSVGGTIAGAATVCSGTNTGTVTLSGHTGTIVKWESSTTGGAPWTAIANTNTTQTFTNLTTTTHYRVEVKSGVCNSTLSTVAIITVDPIPTTAVAGPTIDRCEVTTVTMAANAPTVGTGLWTKVSGPIGDFITTPSSNVSTITGLTFGTYVFRWTISSGVCPSSSSDVTVRIFQNPTTANAGTDQNLCNVTSATLAGNIPTVGTGLWSYVSGPLGSTITTPTTNNSAITGLTVGTYKFKWTISNGSCTPSPSEVTIIIHPGSVPGTLTGPTPICINTGTTLTLTGNTGSIVRWEKAVSPFSTWTTINDTSNSINTGNLAQNTSYRVIVKSGGVCNSVFSNEFEIKVNPTSVGGTLAGATTVCSGTNSGTLTLSGHTGTVVKWESGPSATGPWTAIANTTTTQTFTNLTATTHYRVEVKSGVCSSTVSTVAIITVDPIPTTANAGSNIASCEATSVSMVANAPTVGTGLWTKVSGPAGGIITTPTSNISTITGLTYGTYVFKWTISSGVCSTSSSDVTVRIFQNPTTANAGPDQNLCNVNAATLAGNIPTVGTGLWSYVTGPLGSTLTTPTANNTTITGLTVGTYKFKWTISNGVCTPSTKDVTIVVHPASAPGTITGTSPICFNSSSTLTLTGNTGSVVRWEKAEAPSFVWTSVANATATLITGNLIKTTRYRVAVLSGGVCNEVLSNHFEVVVDPTSVGGSLAGAVTVCSGTNSGTLTLSGHIGNVQKWESGPSATGPWTAITNTTTTQTFTNLTATTHYRVEVKSGVCSSTVSTVAIITVDPIPTTANAGSNIASCEATSVSMAANAPTVGTGLWTKVSGPAGGIITTPSSNISTITGLTYGTYVFKWTISSGVCSASSSDVTVRIFQNPTTANAGPDQNLCNVIAATLAGNIPTVGTGQWSYVTGPLGSTLTTPTANNTTITGLTVGTYVYRWTISNGACTPSTKDVTIVVHPGSVPGTISGTSPICYNTGTTLTLSGNTGNVVRWEKAVFPFTAWTTVTNTTGILSTGSLTQTTQYRVAVLSAGVCSEVLSIPFEVVVDPTSVGGTLAGAATVCSGTNSGTLTLSGHTGTIVKWEMAVSPFSSWTTISNTNTTQTYSNLTATTHYRVEVKSGVCSSTVSTVAIITVDPIPTTANAGSNIASCEATSVSMAANAPTVGTGLWTKVSGPAGGIITTPTSNISTITGLTYGTYVFKWTISSGVCSASSSDVTVRIFQNPTTANAGPDQNLCNVTAATLAGNIPTVGTGLWSQVSGPNTAVFANVAINNTGISGLSVGTYKFKWTITNGVCTPSSSEVTLIIHPGSVPGTLSSNKTICEGENSGILSLVGNTGSINRWEKSEDPFSIWTSISDTLKTFTSPNLFISTKYRVVVQSGTCGEALSNEITITVIPKILGNSITSDQTICQFEAPLTLQGIPMGGSGSFTYQWQLSLDGTSFTNITGATNQTFSPGALSITTFYKRITSSIPCIENSNIIKITVNPKPTAKFTITLNKGCAPLTALVSNTSTLAATYLWSLAPNSIGKAISISNPTAQSPTFSFVDNLSVTDTIYRIRLIVTSNEGCKDTVIQSIEVYKRPNVDFSFTGQNCGPMSINFTNNTTILIDNTWNWTVNPAIGVTIINSNSQDPEIKIPENLTNLAITYTIKLTASNLNNCVNFKEKQIVVYPKPKADFTLNKTTGCGPLSIAITNTSDAKNGETKGTLSYSWNFGNGQKSALQIPGTIIYTNTGTIDSIYTITLIVQSQHGCRDTITKSITVHTDAKAVFTSTNTLECAPFIIKIITTPFPNANSIYTWFANNVQIATGPTFPGYTISTPNTSVTIKLITTALNGCKSDEMSMVFNTIPNPIANFDLSPTNGCTPLIVSFTNLSTAGVSSFWNFGNGNTLNGTIPTTQTYINPGITNLDFKVKLVIVAGSGCKDSIEKTVTVFPKPKAAFSYSPTAGCAPLTANVNNTSTLASSYLWSLASTSSGKGLTISDTIIQNPTFSIVDNLSLIDSVYRVRLIVTSTEGCKDTISPTITVYKRPKVDFSFVGQNCGPMSFTVTNNTTTSNIWNWSVLPSTGVSVTNSSSQDPVISLPENFSNSALTYLIKLTATTDKSCVNFIEKSIIVYPKPKADFTLNKTTGCGPLSVAITNTSDAKNGETKGTLSYSWNFGNGQTSIQQNPGTIIFTNLGTTDIIYTVTLIVQSQHGCRDTITKSITVYPNSKALFTSPKVLSCAPFTLAINTNLFPNANNSYNWYANNIWIGSGSTFPGHTILNANDSINIKLVTTALNGCLSDSLTVKFNTIPNPVPNFSINPNKGCNPLIASFTNLSSPGITSYWDFKNGNTSNLNSPNPETFINLGTSNLNYKVKLIITAGSGCKDSIEKTLTVYPLPKIALKALDTVLCYPYYTILTNISGNSPVISSYLWRVYGVVNDSLSNPTSSTTTTLSLPDNQSGIDRYFKVTLIGYSIETCEDSASITIRQPSRPVANFGLSQTALCGPNSINLIDSSLYSVSLKWFSIQTGVAFSNPLIKNPTITFPVNLSFNDSVYTIGQIAFSADGCTDTVYKNFVVHPKPKAIFNASTIKGCGPLTVNFTDTSISSTTLSYEWNFGDGSAFNYLQNPTHTFNGSSYQDTVFTVQQIITSANGCNDTTYKNITIEPGPTAKIGANITSICIGAKYPPATIQFTNNSFGQADNYIWNFDDGTPLITTLNNNSVNHTFSKEGIYWVKLKATNNCNSSTDSIKITVYESPISIFSTTTKKGCGPLSVTFTNNSKSIGTNFYWDFRNGITFNGFEPTNPIIFKADSSYRDTFYTVTVTAINPCDTSSYSDTIWVRPLPKALFSVDKTIGCSPMKVNIINFSLGGPNLYFWDYGNGITDTISTRNSQIAYITSVTDSFNLKLVTQNECGIDSLTYSILVYPNTVYPGLIVQNSSLVGCAPHTVRFVNISVGASRFKWDFKDGNGLLYTLKSPDTIYRTFNNPGTYLVELEASNGCSDTSAMVEIIVNPKPKADFSTNQPNYCFGDTLKLINNSVGYSSSTWIMDDGKTYTTTSPSHVYAQPGTYKIKLIVSQGYFANGGICYDTIEKNVIIEKIPIINMAIASKFGCEPFVLNINANGTLNASLPGSTYSWLLFDKNGTIQGLSGIAPANLILQTLGDNKPRVIYIRLTVKNQSNCNAVYLDSIVINPKPKSNYLVSTNFGCAPLNVQFTNKSDTSDLLGYSYYWSFGNGGNSTQTSPSYIYQSGGLYNSSLITTNMFSCRDTMYEGINVMPKPMASFTHNANPQHCQNEVVAFSSNGSGGSIFNWDFDAPGTAGNTQTGAAVNFVFPKAGTYNVKLKVFNSFGCVDSTFQIINIIEIPIASFTPATVDSCGPIFVSFKNTSTYTGPTIVTYKWLVDNALVSNSKDYSQLFTIPMGSQNPKVYSVKMMISNGYGCNDTFSTTVKVNPNPSANFSVTPLMGCEPLQLTAINNSIAVTNYRWYLNNVLTSSDSLPSFTLNYPPDSVNIKLVVTNLYGCKPDSISKLVIVNPKPIVDFTVKNAVTCVGPTSIKFDNNTQYGSNYYWNFGDGTAIDTNFSPNHLFTKTGIYFVKLFVTNNFGCLDSIVKSISIGNKVTALFAPDAVLGCYDLRVNFKNNSKNAINYIWNFGDGSTSTRENPTHFYSYIGNPYTVTLIAIGEFGCSDTLQLKNLINVLQKPIANFDIDDTLKYIPKKGFQFYNRSSADVTTFRWQFGDGGNSKLENPYHAYKDTGNYFVTLIVLNSNNCADTIIKKIRVEHVDGKLFVPTAITPESGPLYLQYFLPKGRNIATYNLELFNPWGELIFTSTQLNNDGEPSEPWDAKVNGTLVPQGVYVWKIKAYFIDGSEWKGQETKFGFIRKTGTVTILR